MRMRRSAMLAAAAAAVACAQIAQRGLPEEPERRSAVVKVVEKVGPAVVNIATETLVRRRVGGYMRFGDDLFDKAFEDFFSGRPRYRDDVVKSIGSGVIFDAAGYCLTNEHVVRRAGSVTVRLSDGRSFPAKPLALDPDNDLAVLRIEAKEKLPVAEFHADDSILIGETVVAIGNPFGLENSVTTGVVSGTGRVLGDTGGAHFDDLIQTDAAINPGNSGGPLLSIDGRIIGIASAIRADAQGIGFAIPADRVKAFVRRALPGPGDVPELGFGLEAHGGAAGGAEAALMVAWASKDCPLRVGDVLLQLGDSRAASSPGEAATAIRAASGRSLAAVVLRGGQRASVEIDLSPMRESEPLVWRSLRCERIAPQLAARFALQGASGAVVTEVAPGSNAARMGFEPGDVVRQINRTPVESLADLRRAAKAVGNDDALVIFARSGRLYYGVLGE